MSNQFPSILVTGFGAFPGAAQNPSETLARAVADRHERPERKIVCGILPTNWQKVETALTKLFAQHNPDYALHLGYAATSPGFQLESTAYNETCGKPDDEGMSGTCGPVRTNAPSHFASTTPLAKIETALFEQRFKTIRSDDPGRYLCNMAYYLSLSRSKTRPCPSLFVHIPAIKTGGRLIPREHEGANHLSLSQALRGFELIITTMLDQPAGPPSAQV